MKEFGDVVLLPFPLESSKDAVDAIYVSRPFVTLPTEYMRGRKGYSLYRTMDLSELVAYDAKHYIEIADKLYTDSQFYQSMVQTIEQRKDLVFEDFSVSFSFLNFLLRLSSLPQQDFDSFLSRNTKSHSQYEKAKENAKQRVINQKNFDMKYKKQYWMLENRTVKLESSIGMGEIPLLFQSIIEK